MDILLSYTPRHEKQPLIGTHIEYTGHIRQYIYYHHSIHRITLDDSYFEQSFHFKFPFVVCTIFLLDFFVRWYYSSQGWTFVWRNLFFLFVSIPYLNLVTAFTPVISHNLWITLRLIPLAGVSTVFL